MKTIRWVIGIIMVVVIITAGYFVTKGPSEPVSTSQTKIGVIVGASGQYAVVGENYIKGVELARDIWLEQYPDQQIELIIEDDAFDPKKGLAAYQKLTGINKVDALINMTSPTIDSIYSNIRQSGIPVAQGGEQGVEPTDDNVFQLLPGNIATEIALGKFMKDKGYTKVVAFYANNATYIRFLNGFKQGYSGAVSEFPISIEDRDYRTHVTKAIATRPDAILFIATPEQGASLVKLLREQSTERYPYFFDANVQTGFADYKRILGDTNVLNGSTVVAIRQHTNPNFAGRYKERYKEEPGIAADWAYDSFDLLMRARANNWTDWVQNMKKISFDGAGGKVEFDEVGVRRPDFMIGVIANGDLPK